MKKRIFTKALLAMVMVFTLAAGTVAGAKDKDSSGDAKTKTNVSRVDVDGISFNIPKKVRSLVTVKTGGKDFLVKVSETASIKAAKETGQDVSAAGWLFSISRISGEEMKKARCSSMDGMQAFARDGEYYYIYNHPTDVRLIRKQYKNIKKDQKQWSMLNEWAAGKVRKDILANNPGLEAVNYTNTTLDIYLAQAAFQGKKYEIRSLEYGTLDPSSIDSSEYLMALTDGAVYKELHNRKAPDGEYIVLKFKDVRYDFFLADDGRNLIRETRKVGSDTYETLYKASFRKKGITSTGVMEDWCKAISKAG